MSRFCHMVLLVVLFAGTLPSALGGECRDVLDRCSSYGANACSGYFKTWASKYCKKTCKLCNNVPTCKENGKSYKKGHQWIVNYKTRNTCLDPLSNHVQMADLCYTWKNQPSDICHMIPPAPGKCCPQPWCQPGKMALQYPKGYKIE